MKRVCVVITARPSYSRVKSVLASLQARSDTVELQIVAAASALVTRYGAVVDQMRADGYAPHAEVRSVLDDDSPAGSAVSTGVLLSQLPGVFERLRPDVVVTIADRHETLATAISASYMNIPLCHIQGGEVSGSIDDRVRDAVTQLADIHCVSTALAAQKIAALRELGSEWSWSEDDNSKSILVTGCPSIDLARDAKALGPIQSYDVIVLQHAVTDEYEQAEFQMQETIRALKGVERVGWWWPGEDAGNAASAKAQRLAGLKPIRNLPPVEFLRTLLGARVLVGNSSVGIRECSYLGVPVVNLGTRQSGRERGQNVVDIPHQAEAIRWAVYEQMGKKYPESHLYGDGQAGDRIAGILAGEKVKEAVA